MKNRKIAIILVLTLMIVFFVGCSANNANEGISFETESQSSENTQEYFDAENINSTDNQPDAKIGAGTDEQDKELPFITPGEAATEKSIYTDNNGDTVIIPARFTISANEDEQTICSGLVIIGSDGSEFVWVPTTETIFARNDFGSYGFYDETDSEEYQSMKASVEEYGGFYMGRYEASYAGGNDVSDYVPASKKADSASVWVHVPPQEMVQICANLYAENENVVSFLPWGINWDTTVQWLIDSGCKTEEEVLSDSTGWGNYSNNTFADDRGYGATGQWEETKANNIYDLAGNYWEWTQERAGGGGYAARAGGYSIMGGPCTGDRYPVVFRSGLPGNDHHPNITFRVALYLR